MDNYESKFEIEEVKEIDAPGSGRDFVEGVVTGLAIASFICGGC